MDTGDGLWSENHGLMVTGWGYGLWTIADERTDSYIGFYAAMDGAMDGFARWLLATARHS